MPSSVKSVSGMDVGDMVPESTDSIVSPETFVVVLPPGPSAMTVTVKAVPAVPESGASTKKLSNTPLPA
jgi:hypothetical protein